MTIKRILMNLMILVFALVMSGDIMAQGKGNGQGKKKPKIEQGKDKVEKAQKEVEEGKDRIEKEAKDKISKGKAKGKGKGKSKPNKGHDLSLIHI